MPISHPVPIALFTYNRPRHAERALRALAQCADREHCRLHIFCDGPKQPDHREAVEATRAVVGEWGDRLGARLIIRDTNLGLSRSIAGAVSDLVDAFGSVIVLEDDLVPAPDFLSFMLAGLETYKNENRVAQISGTLLVPEVECATAGLFLPLSTTWGWATWSRAWADFPDIGAVSLAELERDSQFRARFTLGGRADYMDMLERRLSGANDSWGILWWYSVAKDNRLVLYPRKNLVWNGGFDGSGVHCDGQDIYRDGAPQEFSAPRFLGPIDLPEKVMANEDLLERIVQDYFCGSNLVSGGMADASKIGRTIGRLRTHFGSFFRGGRAT